MGPSKFGSYWSLGHDLSVYLPLHLFSVPDVHCAGRSMYGRPTSALFSFCSARSKGMQRASSELTCGRLAASIVVWWKLPFMNTTSCFSQGGLSFLRERSMITGVLRVTTSPRPGPDSPALDSGYFTATPPCRTICSCMHPWTYSCWAKSWCGPWVPLLKLMPKRTRQCCVFLAA